MIIVAQIHWELTHFYGRSRKIDLFWADWILVALGNKATDWHLKTEGPFTIELAMPNAIWSSLENSSAEEMNGWPIGPEKTDSEAAVLQSFMERSAAVELSGINEPDFDFVTFGMNLKEKIETHPEDMHLRMIEDAD